MTILLDTTTRPPHRRLKIHRLAIDQCEQFGLDLIIKDDSLTIITPPSEQLIRYRSSYTDGPDQLFLLPMPHMGYHFSASVASAGLYLAGAVDYSQTVASPSGTSGRLQAILPNTYYYYSTSFAYVSELCLGSTGRQYSNRTTLGPVSVIANYLGSRFNTDLDSCSTKWPLRQYLGTKISDIASNDTRIQIYFTEWEKLDFDTVIKIFTPSHEIPQKEAAANE